MEQRKKETAFWEAVEEPLTSGVFLVHCLSTDMEAYIHTLSKWAVSSVNLYKQLSSSSCSRVIVFRNVYNDRFGNDMLLSFATTFGGFGSTWFNINPRAISSVSSSKSKYAFWVRCYGSCFAHVGAKTIRNVAWKRTLTVCAMPLESNSRWTLAILAFEFWDTL